MITVKNVRTLGGSVVTHTIESSHQDEIDAQKKLLLFPGVIDPHLVLGPVVRNSWELAIKSCIRGGITTVVDLLQNPFLYKGKKELESENHKIMNKLSDLRLPVSYFRFLPCTQDNFTDIEQLGTKKSFIKGVVIYLDQDVGEELNVQWENLFRLAAHADLPVVINSRNENTTSLKIKNGNSLLENGIRYAEKWGCRLLILNVSTRQEIELIKAARKKQILVYAETTPQHLFSNKFETHMLWDALNEDVIEVIGSGYNVTQQGVERILYHGENFNALDPIFLLPRLLTASEEKKLPLEKVLQLTSTNIQDMLELNKTHDFVLIDLEKEETVTLLTEGKSIEMKLKGWPAHTIVDGQVFSYNSL